MAKKRYQITIPPGLTKEQVYLLFSEMAADPYITTPATINEEVHDLCRTRLGGAQPYYVPVEPDPRSKLNECFNNVTRWIGEHGGQMELGWCIGEWPTIFVEAEHHAIWVTPDGRRVDVTRRKDGEQNILFAPDPTTAHTPGTRRDNRRAVISRHPAAAEFLRISGEISREMGPDTGPIMFTERLFELELQRGFLQQVLRKMTPRALVEQAWVLAKTARAGS